MKNNSIRNAKNQSILNQLKKETYSKKEGIYARLIINVLEEANKFSNKLSNVYVNHNIIERILLNENLSFIYDEFGRSIDEFSPKFIKACKELNSQFSSDYPSAHLYTKDYNRNYYTSLGFGTRIFMRKIINYITQYLNIEVKHQPIFISLTKNNNDNDLFLSYYSGKRYGKIFYRDILIVDRKFKKTELKQLQSEIEAIINRNIYEFEDILGIVDEKIHSVA